MTAGYSGTPLAKKLNLKDGYRCWFDSMPETVADEIAQHGFDLTLLDDPRGGFDAAHIFVTDADSLQTKLSDLHPRMAADGQIWVSWPKKGSGRETQLDQAAVQTIGLATGLVDTKKCAVDAVWSGLKFVIRKEDR